MNYNVQQTSMLIGKIKDDTIQIIYHPKLQQLYTGDSIKIIDETKQGIITQVYQIENLNLSDLNDESLISQASHFNNLTAEVLADDISSLHIANCKIKLSIIGNKWINWRGNLPSISDIVAIVDPEELIAHTLGSSPLNPVNLGTFINQTPIPLQFEASSLEKTSLIIGNTAKDKANLLNIIQKELVTKKAKVLIVDPKGTYKNLSGATILEAGKNHKLSFLKYGPQKLGELIINQTEPKTRYSIDNLYSQIVERAATMAKGFLPFDTIKSILEKEIHTPEGQQHINELSALKSRITSISNLGIFANNPEDVHNIGNIFNNANLIVLDLSSIPSFWQKTFTQKAIQNLTSYNGCSFIFYDDIAQYIDSEIAIELIYKANNCGLNNIFITNYDDIIPSELIKQSENLFLFANDVLEDNPKYFNNLKTDKELLSMLLKRQDENTVLIYGDISNHYPILVELKDSNLSSLKNKHFGSIKKYVSECGEIIYSYKPLEQAPIRVATQQRSPQPAIENYERQQQTPIETFERYSENSSPAMHSTVQQPAYMEKYQTLSEEYDEELLTRQPHTQEYDNFETDESPITFHNKLEDVEQHLFPQQHIGHHIPDDEFMTEQMLQETHGQQIHQQRPQQHSHQIHDDEFIPEQIHRQAPQQRPLPHSHQIPDDEFLTEQILHQQMPQQRPLPHSHQIPDDEFLTEQILHQQMPQQRPLPHSHQIPYDEFFTEQIVQQQMPQQQPKRQAPPPAQQQFQQQIRPESIPDQVEDIPVYASPKLETTSLAFKEGDKVSHERYGIGIINRIITTGDKQLCSIQFQDYGRRLLDPNRGLTKIN